MSNSFIFSTQNGMSWGRLKIGYTKKVRVIDLAVIIPTLNEERYIGVLLDSLAKQTVKPKELIIVDAFSKDKTKQEVEKRISQFPHLQFFQIPKGTIAKQRNYGVIKSSSSHLLFLDADMYLSGEKTLEHLYAKISRKEPDAVTAYVMPLSDDVRDKLMYGLGNVIAAGMQWVKPSGTTMNLYVKRKMFLQLGGFDEEIRVGEDFEFLTRLGKADGRFMVFLKPIVYTSIRRIEYEGRMKFVAKLFRSTFYTKIKGYKTNPMEYEFGHFGNKP